jgi:hypothetical protein
VALGGVAVLTCQQRSSVEEPMIISSHVGRLLVSAIIVAILSIQAVAGFVDTGRWGWPLLAYPMYKWAHYEGDRLDVELTGHAVLEDSTRIPMSRSDLNMDFWLY